MREGGSRAWRHGAGFADEQGAWLHGALRVVVDCHRELDVVLVCAEAGEGGHDDAVLEGGIVADSEGLEDFRGHFACLLKPLVYTGVEDKETNGRIQVVKEAVEKYSILDTVDYQSIQFLPIKKAPAITSE